MKTFKHIEINYINFCVRQLKQYFREICRKLGVHIKEEEKSQIDNLRSHLKNLENQEQNNFKAVEERK